MRILHELDVHHEGVLVGDAVLEGLVVDVQDVLTSADLGRKRMRMIMMINMGMRMRRMGLEGRGEITTPPGKG